MIKFISCILMLLGCSAKLLAQNPIIQNQFTADPTARVFDGKMYVYPSHDIDCGTNWFCMKDYHVFSSENLVDWADHGVILHQNEVAWVDTNANAMWAPDAIERNGRHYFYFPAVADTHAGFRGRRIGVAISERPEGPFKPEPEPIEGVLGIDPNTFIDHDGQAYLYWSLRGVFGAKLNPNMLEIDSEPIRLDEHHPQEGLREGPFMFERKGVYYLTYPRVVEETEALVYATGEHPLGPFEYNGIFMDEHESGCWTNHHSIVKYKDQWYLFYHHNDYSPGFDKNRSIRIDSLFFNSDGTIQKVKPTFRGVGITKATDKIQIDRYTEMSKQGASIAFLNPSKSFYGWKAVLSNKNAWFKYNSVDFGEEKLSELEIRYRSESVAEIDIRYNITESPVLTKLILPETSKWDTMMVSVSPKTTAVHNLVVKLKKGSEVEIDWIRFK